MNKKIEFNARGNQWSVYVRDEADVSVFNEIFRLHEYRIADEVIAQATYPIVDVGAHAGFFTMHARSLNAQVQIFAIEPEPDNIAQLNKHLQDNHIANVKVFPGALAFSSEPRGLIVTEDSHNHYLASAFGRTIEGVGVRALSFKDFCAQHDIKKISLLKIDIEGGEYEVFDGMSEADLSAVQHIVLEYHQGREKSREIEEKLRMNGFGVQVFPSKFDKTMGFMYATNKRKTR